MSMHVVRTFAGRVIIIVLLVFGWNHGLNVVSLQDCNVSALQDGLAAVGP